MALHLLLHAGRMALLKYFKLKSDSVLPNSNGPLSKLVPSSSIIAANEAVKDAISQSTKARGPYVQFTPCIFINMIASYLRMIDAANDIRCGGTVSHDDTFL